jgi:hypothetical protein
MFAIQTLERANGFPQIAIDSKSKRMYITWSDYRNGDLDVFISTSDNGGKRWSAPVRVNNDPVHNGAEQFFQWLAVDPTDGSINVIFYDRRGDPQNRKQIVVLARSTDSGRSFTNYAWTDNPFEASGVFFGDYSGIAAYGGRVYGIWTEKPVPPPAPEMNERHNEDKDKDAEKKDAKDKEAKDKDSKEKDSKEVKDAKPPARGTIVKIGTADFTTAESTR